MKGDGLFVTRFAGYAIASVTYLPSATFVSGTSYFRVTYLSPYGLVQPLRLR
jgi:hypothetical protein